MSQRIDEIGLQRLVEGTLDESERRAFLVDVDRRPEWWREVALAFVEEQIWRQEIAGMQPDSSAEHNCRTHPAPAAARGRSWGGAIALALSLFAALAVGFQLGHVRAPAVTEAARGVEQSEENQHEKETQGIDAAPESESRPAAEAEYLASDFRLLLPHEGGQSVEMPVYDESQVDVASWANAEPVLIETLNRRLSRRGYHADWQTEYLTGRLEDGRQLVVPMRTVSLRYAAQ
jgi:hypothetical protein